jgi:hypothetical protein
VYVTSENSACVRKFIHLAEDASNGAEWFERVKGFMSAARENRWGRGHWDRRGAVASHGTVLWRRIGWPLGSISRRRWSVGKTTMTSCCCT